MNLRTGIPAVICLLGAMTLISYLGYAKGSQGYYFFRPTGVPLDAAYMGPLKSRPTEAFVEILPQGEGHWCIRTFDVATGRLATEGWFHAEGPMVGPLTPRRLGSIREGRIPVGHNPGTGVFRLGDERTALVLEKGDLPKYLVRPGA